MKTFNFSRGFHQSREDGMCVMESVAFLAGEGHTYYPECASYSISRLAIFINDLSDDEFRNRELQELPWRIVGTYSPDVEPARLRLLEDFRNKHDIKDYCYPVARYPEKVSQIQHNSGKITTDPTELEAILRDGLALLDKMIVLTELKEVVPAAQPEGTYNA